MTNEERLHDAEEKVVSGPTHPPAAEKIAAVDFDGTIKPWHGGLFGDIEPLPGAAEAVRKLKDAGYTIFIFTSRLSTFWHHAEGWDTTEATREQVEYIRGYCEKYDIPADFVTAEKIPAECYLDDKALQVDASHSILSQVETFLSEGLFWLKPANSRVPARWHRVEGEPKRHATTNSIGTFYRWSGKAVCGQDLYGLSGENFEDLFKERRYGARLSRTRDVEKGYCQHCQKKDRKREQNAA